MDKDPAFIFYTQDFLVGTTLMSDVEVGIYIRLLCFQHQFGGKIDKKTFEKRTKKFPLIQEKFIKTAEGYYNERLMKEMIKRRKKSNNLSDNAKKRWDENVENENKSNAIASDLHMPIECKSNAIASDLHMPLHMPIENEIENEININTVSNSNEHNINEHNINEHNINEHNINKENINNDQLIGLFIKGFKRHPGAVEIEETRKLVHKYGLKKMNNAFIGSALRNFRSLQGLINSLDEKGKLLTYEEKNNKKIDEPEYHKQPNLG